MRFIDDNPNEPFTTLRVEHGDSSLRFDLKYYGRPTGARVESVFGFLNAYIETLPENRRAAIFDCYLRASKMLDSILDPNRLHLQLTQLTRELFELIQFPEIQYWTKHHGNIRVPTSIRDAYHELEISERNQALADYEARTYLRQDYLELVNLAITLKAMIPIWASYARIMEESGHNSNFRELYCMKLLNLSNVVKTEPLLRLRGYVETASPDSRTMMSAALNGLGSSEMPDWLMSIAVIRKLVIIELSSYDDSNNIISVIYHHVRNTIKSVDRKFAGRVSDKIKPRGDDDDENKSIVETYKEKEEVAIGDILPMRVYATNAENMLRRIDPTAPVEVLHAAMHAIRDSYHPFIPTEGQLTLLSWIIPPALPARSPDNLNKDALLCAFPVAQTLLWHWGYKDLALMLTASEVRDHRGNLIGGVDSKTRIPKEYVAEFAIYYPHAQEKGSTKDRERQTNEACKGIDRIAKEFVRCDWSVRFPAELYRQHPTVDASGVMPPPNDIKTQLAQIVLNIAKEQEKQYVSQ